MRRTAEAVCHGAVTVVNAMATGMGAALGVDLWTRAKVTLTDRVGTIAARNLSEPKEDSRLSKITVRRVLSKYGGLRKFGAIVETRSNIPVAVGLKSSSSASNAIAFAAIRALGVNAADSTIVNLAVDASLSARVALTGAFDDAMACYAGGLVVTDNFRRKVLGKFGPKERARVLICIPEGKKYSKDVDRRKLRAIAPTIDVAHREAARGNYWLALTLNGTAYSQVLGYNDEAARRALEAGAIAAGLSGKGPATATIVPLSKVDAVRSAWSHIPGRVIEASINRSRAQAW